MKFLNLLKTNYRESIHEIVLFANETSRGLSGHNASIRSKIGCLSAAVEKISKELRAEVVDSTSLRSFRDVIA